MPTTPVVPDGIIRFRYVAVGIPHLINIRVNLVRPYTVGSMPTIKARSGAGANLSSDAFTLLFLTDAIIMYRPSDHFDSYEVYDVTTSPPTFVFGKSITGYTGTASGGTTQTITGETVITFRDANSKIVHFDWMGTTEGNLTRRTTYAGTFFANFVTNLLSSAAGATGDFVTGRSGGKLVIFMSEDTQQNNAIERRILHP